MNSQIALSPEGRSLRFHLIAATAVYVFDALIFGQGGIAFLIAAIFFLVGVFKTLFRVVKRQTVSRTPLIKMGIYALCFGAVVSTIALNNSIARNRAEVIISAVKQYKAKYGRFPDKLQALIPEYLPSVPKAKYSFAFNEFTYWRLPGKTAINTGSDSAPKEMAALLYVALPPFGRPTYNFDRDRWGYVD